MWHRFLHALSTEVLKVLVILILLLSIEYARQSDWLW